MPDPSNPLTTLKAWLRNRSRAKIAAAGLLPSSKAKRQKPLFGAGFQVLEARDVPAHMPTCPGANYTGAGVDPSSKKVRMSLAASDSDWDLANAQRPADNDFIANCDVPSGPEDSPVARGTGERELVIVDTQVDHWGALVRSIQTRNPGRDFEIAMLDPSRDGFDQVNEILARHRDLASVHLISHGSSGSLLLGRDRIDGESLRDRQFELRQWGAALREDGDLALYGCDVAAGVAGHQFVRELARLTGVDVAASTDRTGNAAVGGDWELEYQVGRIDVASLFASDQPEWDGALAVGDPIAQSYFVPLPETNLRGSYATLYAATSQQIQSIVSIATSSLNTIVVYDQAEDGYEADLNNPTQSSTRIWGDGIASNGVAPGFADDRIPVGGSIVLQNRVDLPRDTGDLLFDGGDRIASTRAVAVTRAAYATNPGTVLASAVDVYDVSKYGTNFHLPVGQNTPNANTIFEYVSLYVQAAEDGTTVEIDTNGDGTVDVTRTIDRGQTTQVNGILQGATVNSDKPVQVQLITGDIGASYSSRSFTIAPTSQWSSSYVTPVSTTLSSAPQAVFFYNPGTSAITVNYATQAGTGSLSVPARGTARFTMPMNTGASFTSAGGQPFYAVGSMDSDASSTSHDWGFRLIPSSNLTTAALVGYGPGTSNLSANGSPVWVTSLAATRIYADFDGNPLTGALTDPTGKKYDQHFDVTPLQSVRIFDHADNNQTGMKVYTIDGTRIAAAWGQDPSRADPGNPFLDMGTLIPPLPIWSTQVMVTLLADRDGNGRVSPGDDIRYSIATHNEGVVPLLNVRVSDIVPAGTNYIAGSARLNGVTIGDQSSGTAFPLDDLDNGIDTGYLIGLVAVGQSATISFDLNIPAPYTGPVTGISNNARVSTSEGNAVGSVVVPIASNPGQVTFTTSSGSVTKAIGSLQNGTLFLRVSDPDPDRNPGAAETVRVTVVNAATGDRETVTLTETGVNTGVFTATLATSTSTGQGVDDGVLFAVAGNVITASYSDPTFPSDTATDTVTVSAPNVIKQLYLSNEGGGTGMNLDRIDPTRTGTGQSDTTTQTTATLRTTSPTDTITTGSTTTGSTSSGTSVTFAHTPGSGNNRLLLVSVALGGTTNSNNAGTVTGVTFGGTAMTLVGTRTSSAIKVYLYSLVNPSSAAGNVVVSVSGASSIYAGATTFNNVDQATPLGTLGSTTAGSGTSGSVTVSSSADQLVYSLGAWDEGTSNQSIAVGSGQSELFKGTGFNYVSVAATTKAGASSVTNSFTAGNSQEWAILAVPIRPATQPAMPTATFAQTLPMADAFVIPAGGEIRVVTHVNVTSGTMPANPSVTAILRHGATTFATLANPVYDSTAGTLTWTLVASSAINLSAGEAVSLTVTTAQTGVEFQVEFDSASRPSRIELPTTTYIDITSLSVFDAPYTNDGNAVTSALSGQTVYIRATVTDPFGHADITSQALTITRPNGETFTLSPTTIIPTGVPNTKIYEYAWTPGAIQGTFNVAVTANEGFEGTVSDTTGITFLVNQLDTGTPSLTRFVDLGGSVVTFYTPGSNVTVQVQDADKNTSSTTAETISLTITTSTGDVQTVTLTETGNDTGIFRGSVPMTADGSATPNDGTLHAPVGTALIATYQDADDPADSSTSTTTVQSTAPPPNQSPVAGNDHFATTQNNTLMVPVAGVLGNDTDPDAGQTLSVIAVNGSSLNVGATITLSSGARLRVNGNGSLVYIPNHAFDSLAQGETVTDSFSYTVSDGNSGFATATVTISIIGANDAPSIVSNGGLASATVSVPENSASVTRVVGLDPDVGAVLRYAIVGGPDAGRFAIDAISGELRFVVPPDFENPNDSDSNNVYRVVVQVSDGGLISTQTIDVTLTNLNEAPTVTSGISFSVVENTTAITTVTASDPETGTVLTYGIVGGPDAGRFTIDATTGVLRFVLPPNFEAPEDFDGDNVYQLQVQVSDGVWTTTRSISVTVINVNEAPTITSETETVPVSSMSVGIIYIASANDEDFGNQLRFSIVGGADAAFLTIDEVTGAMQFISPPDSTNPHDADGDNHYEVVIQVTDGTLTDTRALSFSVTDSSFAENSTGLVFTPGNLPPDPNRVFSLIGGADVARFTLDPVTGELRFITPPDFENPTDADGDNIYEVVGQLQSGSLIIPRSLRVSVTNVNEAPSIVTGTSLSVDENTSSVGTIQAADPDAMTTFHYSIVGGEDAGRFTIDSATGELRFVVPANFESPVDADGDNVYRLTIRVSDGALSVERTFEVTVRDVNESPVFTSTDRFSVAENSTAVATLTSTDPDTTSSRSYAVAGGPDGALFVVDPVTGALAFRTAPDFEAPADADGDNRYEVLVSVRDGWLTSTQLVVVELTNVNEGPSIRSVPSFQVAENNPLAGEIRGSDPDANANLTYSIIDGSDAARFSIDPRTGRFFFQTAPNFETPADADGNNVYQLTVQVTDGQYTSTQSINVTVTDVNEAPVFTTGSDLFIAENTTFVVPLVATDPDGTSPRGYTLVGGSEASFFRVNPSTGELVFRAAPNFENPLDADGDNVYEVTVLVSDGALVTTRSFSVEVRNANEVPVITSETTTVPVTSLSEGLIHIVEATDVDAGDRVTYRIVGGADAAFFALDLTTGELRFITPPNSLDPLDADRDNRYEVTVRASDSDLSDTQSLTFTVTDSAFLEGSTALVFSPVGLPPDPDRVFSIVGGEDAAAFTIDSLTGELRFAAPPDFERPLDQQGDNIYKVVGQLQSGSLIVTRAFTIQVLDINEAPVLPPTASATVGENAAGVVYQVSPDDPDSDTTFAFAIVGGADAARFTIDPETGELRFREPPDFETPSDANGDNVYQVIVAASDGALVATQTVSVTVSNVNEAPMIRSQSAFSVSENQTQVGTVSASDPDSNTTLRYSIVGGADAALFRIDPATGQIEFLATPDFESPRDASRTNEYRITVEVTDGALRSRKDLTVRVRNVNEAPSLTSGTNFRVAENETGVANAQASDPDQADTARFAIVGGADASLFRIDPVTGELSFVNPPDFESPADADGDNRYEITLSASDGKLTATQDVTVTVFGASEPAPEAVTPPEPPIVPPAAEIVPPPPIEVLSTSSPETPVAAMPPEQPAPVAPPILGSSVGSPADLQDSSAASRTESGTTAVAEVGFISDEAVTLFAEVVLIDFRSEVAGERVSALERESAKEILPELTSPPLVVPGTKPVPLDFSSRNAIDHGESAKRIAEANANQIGSQAEEFGPAQAAATDERLVPEGAEFFAGFPGIGMAPPIRVENHVDRSEEEERRRMDEVRQALQGGLEFPGSSRGNNGELLDGIALLDPVASTLYATWVLPDEVAMVTRPISPADQEVVRFDRGLVLPLHSVDLN